MNGTEQKQGDNRENDENPQCALMQMLMQLGFQNKHKST